MSYATIDDLRSQLGGPAAPSATDKAYAEKMLHALPKAPTVDRAAFILKRCAGRRVLEFGASGPLHEAIVKAASATIGVDLDDAPGVVGFDLDDVLQLGLPVFTDPDLVVCGEVIEHLSNPGWFLTRLKRQYPGVPVIVTVPNAFSRIAAVHVARGIENVNGDHVAWYSPKTLTTLLTRAGYRLLDFAYYNGDGPTAEGLIAIVE